MITIYKQNKIFLARKQKKNGVDFTASQNVFQC